MKRLNYFLDAMACYALSSTKRYPLTFILSYRNLVISFFHFHGQLKAKSFAFYEPATDFAEMIPIRAQLEYQRNSECYEGEETAWNFIAVLYKR